MCALCGTLGGGHWADGLAGPAPAAASADPAARRRARRRQIAVANKVLGRYGLALSDWNGASFLLRGRTGATAMVATISDLWPAADRLVGPRIDPLDPALLRHLTGADDTPVTAAAEKSSRPSVSES